MDKLEQYLDRVCRGVGGPRALRIHVRQELREHLLDATAAHRAAGLPADEALARALEEFGGADEVRSELAESYGHRVMSTVIDQALAWKEKTMKATWLWSSWAHVALGLIIVANVALVAMSMAYLMPFTMRRVDLADVDKRGLSSYLPGSETFLRWIDMAQGGVGILCLALLLAAWITFEWRFRGENKSYIRLAALGTLALGLTAAVAAAAAVVTIPLAVSLVEFETQEPEAVVAKQLAQIETVLAELEQTPDDNASWVNAKRRLEYAREASRRLAYHASAAAAVVAAANQPDVDELQRRLAATHTLLLDAYNAALQEDPAKLEAALEVVRVHMAELRDAIQAGE